MEASSPSCDARSLPPVPLTPPRSKPPDLDSPRTRSDPRKKKPVVDLVTPRPAASESSGQIS
eukprot:12051247-Alexandrium_andersonii.AAC.1